LQSQQEKDMSDVIILPAGADQRTPARRRGRLAFGLDATKSREETWALARELQANMFREAAPFGKLDVQLVFFGGDRCHRTEWVSSGNELARLMGKIVCNAGFTQIGSILDHVMREHAKAPVQALTYIGDSMEEELDVLAGKALQFGAAGVPIFMFHEKARGPGLISFEEVRAAFRLIALKSGGEYFEFNPEKPRAAQQLGEQLNAVARLAVGDTTALTDQRNRK
jgi:hypothetical protein